MYIAQILVTIKLCTPLCAGRTLESSRCQHKYKISFYCQLYKYAGGVSIAWIIVIYILSNYHLFN